MFNWRIYFAANEATFEKCRVINFWVYDSDFFAPISEALAFFYDELLFVLSRCMVGNHYDFYFLFRYEFLDWLRVRIHRTILF